LINYRESYLIKFYYGLFVVPFLIYLVTFIYWTTYPCHALLTEPDSPHTQLNTTCVSVLIFFSLYFALYSFITVYKQPHHAFQLLNFWLWPITSTLVLYCCFKVSFFSDEKVTELPDVWWYVLTYTNIAMFLCLMQVMRHIPYTQESILVFFEIFSKIWDYILVLVMVIFCFSNSFYSLSAINAEGTELGGLLDTIKASYTLALGDFGMNETEITGNTWSSFIIFFISSILLMIIYANILITIVSEGFLEVKEKKVQFIFKDKCAVIVLCSIFERVLAYVSRFMRWCNSKIIRVLYYITWKQ